MLGSQVAAVGRHLHCAGHPCLNFRIICFSAPSGVTVLLAVMKR